MTRFDEEAVDAIRARDARYPAGRIHNEMGSEITALNDRRDLLGVVEIVEPWSYRAGRKIRAALGLLYVYKPKERKRRRPSDG